MSISNRNTLALLVLKCEGSAPTEDENSIANGLQNYGWRISPLIKNVLAKSFEESKDYGLNQLTDLAADDVQNCLRTINNAPHISLSVVMQMGNKGSSSFVIKNGVMQIIPGFI